MLNLKVGIHFYKCKNAYFVMKVLESGSIQSMTLDIFIERMKDLGREIKITSIHDTRINFKMLEGSIDKTFINYTDEGLCHQLHSYYKDEVDEVFFDKNRFKMVGF